MLMQEVSTAVHPDIDRVLVSAEELEKRVAALGKQISADYKGKDLVMVGVLKGSVIFLADLMRHITSPASIDFICMSSYSGDTSTGVVRFLLDMRESAEGRDLLIVEDIVDTGLTLSYLLQNLATRKPRSVEICALLDKPASRKIRIDTKYVGFQIPDEFVVGYGLDYNEKYRNLPYVGVLKRSAIASS